MRIGFLNPTILLRRPIVELAKELQTLGHHVSILTPTARETAPIPAHFETGWIEQIQLPSHEIPTVLWSWPTWVAVRRLWTAVRQYDVIHIWAPYYFVAVLPLLFTRLRGRGAKIVITFDTIPGFSFRFGSILDPLMWAYHWLFGSWFFRLADRRLVYSTQLIHFARLAGLGSSFDVLSSGIRLREQLPPRQPSTSTNILFIGLLNRRKGVAVLIDATAKVVAAGNSIKLSIVGDGPDRANFEAHSNRLNLTTTIEFFGRRNDIQTLYAQSDIFVLPSYGEGLPGVVMEAMMYGRPVITTDIPCLRELIPDQSYGQLVPAGDAEKLAEAIRRYIKDPEAKQTAVRLARSQIEKFSWDRVVPRYSGLYEHLVK